MRGINEACNGEHLYFAQAEGEAEHDSSIHTYIIHTFMRLSMHSTVHIENFIFEIKNNKMKGAEFSIAYRETCKARIKITLEESSRLRHDVLPDMTYLQLQRVILMPSLLPSRSRRRFPFVANGPRASIVTYLTKDS